MRLLDAAGEVWLERHVREALDEDLGTRGDITSQAIIAESRTGRADLIAKSSGILAGGDWAVWTGKMCTPPVAWEFQVQDGDPVVPGQVAATVSGSVRGILVSERTAINGLARLSGIASLSRRAVEAVRGTGAIVLDTRKTIPGWRLAEKYAVRCGGAANHRVGLHDEVLIKENHIIAAGGVAEAIRAARSWIENHGEKIVIEVEVESLDQLEVALLEQPDRILLDNFPPDLMRQAVSRVGDRCTLEASGGITLMNLAEIARTGIHRISLGALTHSATPLDLSLRIQQTA